MNANADRGEEAELGPRLGTPEATREGRSSPLGRCETRWALIYLPGNELEQIDTTCYTRVGREYNPGQLRCYALRSGDAFTAGASGDDAKRRLVKA